MPKPNEHASENWLGRKQAYELILSHRELLSLLRAQDCIELMPDLRRLGKSAKPCQRR